MTVLWILLGVLAAIILLLCLPLTLRLSWLPKPEQPAPCLLTDEVNKEIEALDLPQTDRQLLRQMVEPSTSFPLHKRKKLHPKNNKSSLKRSRKRRRIATNKSRKQAKFLPCCRSCGSVLKSRFGWCWGMCACIT